MKPISYRQQNGDVIIMVEFGDGSERDLIVDKHNINTLLQTVLCAVVNSGDEDLASDARKISGAWLP